MSRFVRVLLVVSLLYAPVIAAANAMLRGELRDAGGPADRFTVHLSTLDNSKPSERAFVASSGTFQFLSVPQGSYLLEVRDSSGNVVKTEMITLAGPVFETSISLGSASALPAMPAGGGTVSLHRLIRDPNGRAAREFSLGEGFLVKQDLVNARKHLAKAVEADPDYAEAHLELGTTAFRSGRIDEARSEFERAVELDPKQVVAWSNLAVLLFQTKTYDEAERAARRGLDAAPNDAKLHFLAGASLFARGAINTKTLDHLEQAARGYPNAHLLLAEALNSLGRGNNAIMHLRPVLLRATRRSGHGQRI